MAGMNVIQRHASCATRRPATRRGVLGGAGVWLAGVTPSVVAACSGWPSRASDATAAVPARHTEPVTLRLDLKASDEALWPFFAPRFTARFPTITVRAESIPGVNADYQAKVIALAASDQLSDVLYSTTTSGLFDVLVTARQLRPVDDLVRADRLDLKLFYKTGTDLLTRGGKLYALPNICNPGSVIVYYNHRLLDGAGAAVPTPDWTPDDAVTAARKVTTASGEGGGVWGYVLGLDAVAVVAMIQSFGGRWLSPDGTKAELNRPETRQAIVYMADLINRYKVAPPPSANATFPGGSTLRGFLNGQVAMLVGVTTNANDILAATQLQAGTSLLPRVRPSLPRGVMRVDGWSVTAGSKYPREAWEVVKFIAGPEGALARAEAPGQAGALGCTTAAWADPQTAARLGPMQQMLSRVLGESEVNILAANYRNDEWGQVLNQKLAPVWSGEAQVSNALMEDLQHSVQIVLDMPKPT